MREFTPMHHRAGHTSVPPVSGMLASWLVKLIPVANVAWRSR